VKSSDYQHIRFFRPKGFLAGFSLDNTQEPGSPLQEAGEQWATHDNRIGSHANQGWELFYQTKGGSEWQYGRKRFSVQAGGYYLIAPGMRHSLLRFLRLRTTNRPVTQIAIDLGFSSSQHFANAFRKIRGRSPSEERRLGAG